MLSSPASIRARSFAVLFLTPRALLINVKYVQRKTHTTKLLITSWNTFSERHTQQRLFRARNPGILEQWPQTTRAYVLETSVAGSVFCRICAKIDSRSKKNERGCVEITVSYCDPSDPSYPKMRHSPSDASDAWRRAIGYSHVYNFTSLRWSWNWLNICL